MLYSSTVSSWSCNETFSHTMIQLKTATANWQTISVWGSYPNNELYFLSSLHSVYHKVFICVKSSILSSRVNLFSKNVKGTLPGYDRYLSLSSHYLLLIKLASSELMLHVAAIQSNKIYLFVCPLPHQSVMHRAHAQWTPQARMVLHLYEEKKVFCFTNHCILIWCVGQ